MEKKENSVLGRGGKIITFDHKLKIAKEIKEKSEELRVLLKKALENELECEINGKGLINDFNIKIKDKPIEY